MNFKHLLGTSLTLIIVAWGLAVSCDKSSSDDTDLDVRFSVPSAIQIEQNNPEIRFKVLFDMQPRVSDFVIFTDKTGIDHPTSIKQIDADGGHFTVDCKNVATFGNYSVYAARGSRKKFMGETTVTISDGIKPENGANMYGKVSCDGNGIADVIISDGTEVVKTNASGVYQMKSKKRYMYVFISTPSGYETGATGILPINYFKLTKSADVAERVDFSLRKAPDQTSHTMLVFGDMHLAGGHNNDRKWFSTFCDDVNEYVGAHASEALYGITLGDMTWDYYWYSNSYQFSQYLADANKIKNLMIYHTIGNHDHDMNEAGDFNTILKYISMISPDYYSFNVGHVHYVVLDNILCTNNGHGAHYRTYKIKITDEQLDWLSKDISFIPKTSPVVVTMHAPVYQLDSPSRNKLLEILSGYNVNVITGHTHKVFNQNITANVLDHNSGAICTDWWNSANNTNGALSITTDGAPAGYQIFTVNGTSVKWQFKPTSGSVDYQFRTYDRNQIDLSASQCMPNASEVNKTFFNDFASTWASSSTANEVYINIWNFASDWKLEVSENGKALTTEKVNYRDPLHILTTSVKYMTSNAKTTYYTTAVCSHLWKVTASSPTSTLEIKVTDGFGNVYSDTMKRPKAFDVTTYAKEIVK